MTGINSTRTYRNRADIFIVGAGPAGLSAAENLIKGGASVTLVDRSMHPGTKACAGGLTREALTHLNIEETQHPHFFDMDVVSKKGRIRLDAPDGRPLMVTVDRPKLQQEQLVRLQDLGVAVRQGERFIGITAHRAVTQHSEFPFGVIIGADGAQSRVRRQLGLPRGRAIKALQLRLPKSAINSTDISLQRPSVYFDSALLQSGYGWIFPFEDEIRMGIGLLTTELKRPIRRLFTEWLAQFGLCPTNGRLESGTITCEYQGHRFGTTYLAGDAAGMASPLTGEGMGQALFSGSEVAKEILDPSYRSDTIARLAAKHRRTLDALSATGLKRLLDVAPTLLRINAIKAQTLKRFVY